MSHRLIIKPEAEAEIEEASRWYAANNPVLRTEFLRDVDDAVTLIQANPLQYQIVYKSIRRVILRRFPYGLMYIVSGQEIFVLACIHGRRHPARWQRRTSD